MTFIFIAWCILQFIANVLLTITLIHASIIYKISITIHNFPIILLWIIGLIGVSILSIMHLNMFIMAGSFIGFLIWSALSMLSSNGVIKKIFMCLLGVVFWSQILTIMIFFMMHEDRIEEFDHENYKHR